MSWLERARVAEGPVYLAIARAIEAAIRDGELHPGDRLPAQRTVAQTLGVDLTTVTRAYAAAQARGLLEGTTGRGTFVRAPQDDESGVVDLSMNLPPPPEGVSLGTLLRETVADLMLRSDPAILMAYHPGFGTVGQRAAAAKWLEPCLGPLPADRLLVSPGAQAALAAVLGAVCRPGDTVVAEPLTYPGFVSIARRFGLRLIACPVDADGVIPTALEDICARERPAALYLVPTMQNPTATTMAPGRRREIAGVAEAKRLWIIEDDPYSRLQDAPAPALAALAPERTFHVATLAKCLSPGLRIAYLACPTGWTEPVAEGLRAISLMPAPLMAAVATRWIQEGSADTLLAAVKAEVRARRAIAAKALPQAEGSPDSIHVWLPLPDARASDRLRTAAQARGVAMVTAEAFAVGEAYPAGARISLGGPSKRATLDAALRALAAGLEGGAAPLVV